MGKFFEFQVPLLDQFGLCNPYGATISDCGAQLIRWWMKSSTTNYIFILLLHSTVIKGKICHKGVSVFIGYLPCGQFSGSRKYAF